MPESGSTPSGTPGRAAVGAPRGAAQAGTGPRGVGVAAHPPLLKSWGLDDDAAGLRRFSLTVLEAVGSLAAAVKPQVALYERHGSAGMAVLEEVLA